MHLPQKGFQWVQDCNQLLIDLPNMKIDGNKGFVAEVDLLIPDYIHDFTDDLPLAPERKLFGELSPFMKSLWEENESKTYNSKEKLLLTHETKQNYVIHFALLKFYLEMGVQVVKIHRAISFYQSALFKE